MYFFSQKPRKVRRPGIDTELVELLQFSSKSVYAGAAGAAGDGNEDSIETLKVLGYAQIKKRPFAPRALVYDHPTGGKDGVPFERMVFILYCHRREGKRAQYVQVASDTITGCELHQTPPAQSKPQRKRKKT